jgi:hypothetical protein
LEKAVSFEAMKPKTTLGICVVLFLTELISFFILCANTRAEAAGNYTWTALTNLVFDVVNFAIFKWMAEDAKSRTWSAGFSGSLGGMLGSMFSIYVTAHLF